MRAEVLLFGPQAELTGTRKVEIELTPGKTTCAEVLRRLGEVCVPLRDSLPSSRLAVDHAFPEPDRVLAGDEELALIGLVGGG
ncbi:MAG: MoaD/ThiS family protein [Planctomycetota bacterium]